MRHHVDDLNFFLERYDPTFWAFDVLFLSLRRSVKSRCKKSSHEQHITDPRFLNWHLGYYNYCVAFLQNTIWPWQRTRTTCPPMKQATTAVRYIKTKTQTSNRFLLSIYSDHLEIWIEDQFLIHCWWKFRLS